MVIRVALVNDDEVVVRGLDAMMRSYSHRVEVVELAAGKPVSQPVDVALYDTFGMGQGNGPAVKHLVDNPQVRTVAVYTWNFQPWLTRDTLNTGVRGYLSKSLPAARLVDALQPGDRRAHAALAELDQVLHPLGLPQDRGRLPLQGRALGRRARHAGRPGADQRVPRARLTLLPARVGDHPCTASLTS